MTYKYVKTLPHMFAHASLSCPPVPLPPFHPLHVILGIEDSMLPVAFKLTLKPQSQCYIYLADAWWALDDNASPAMSVWGLAEVRG